VRICPLLSIILTLPGLALAQAERRVFEPIPEAVTALGSGAAPSDAIVLFDGSDLNAWQHIRTGNQPAWRINDDRSVTVVPGTGSIETRRSFADIQLHLEWRTDPAEQGEGQTLGNSGIFFQSLYEVQILESFANPTYVNGQAGSVYLQHAPLVNASRPAGEWQSYDIIYISPRWDERGNLQAPAYVTLFHNGVLVQNHTEILGMTFTPEPEYQANCVPYQLEGERDCTGKLPLRLQDHGQLVSFRNIWIRELDNR